MKRAQVGTGLLATVAAVSVTIPAAKQCREYTDPPAATTTTSTTTTTTSTVTLPSQGSGCPKLSRPVQCTEGQPEYLGAVRKAIAEVLDVEPGDGTHYDLARQRSATIATMRRLEAQGFCASYDVDHGNAGALASEMGARRGDTLAEWYQLFASDGRVRWVGMYRSTCRPAADEEQLHEVEAFWAADFGRRCPLTVSEAHPLRLKVDVRQGAAGALWLDATYEYFYGVREDGTNAGPCGDPRTGAPRRWCGLGVDGGVYGSVCADELGGDPVFTPLDGGVELRPRFRDNPYLAQAFVTTPGRARVCSPIRPEVCDEVALP